MRGKVSPGEAGRPQEGSGKVAAAGCWLPAPGSRLQPSRCGWCRLARAASQAVMQEWKDFREEGKEVLRATDPELRRRSCLPFP